MGTDCSRCSDCTEFEDPQKRTNRINTDKEPSHEPQTIHINDTALFGPPNNTSEEQFKLLMSNMTTPLLALSDHDSSYASAQESPDIPQSTLAKHQTDGGSIPLANPFATEDHNSNEIQIIAPPSNYNSDNDTYEIAKKANHITHASMEGTPEPDSLRNITAAIANNKLDDNSNDDTDINNDTMKEPINNKYVSFPDSANETDMSVSGYGTEMTDVSTTDHILSETQPDTNNDAPQTQIVASVSLFRPKSSWRWEDDAMNEHESALKDEMEKLQQQQEIADMQQEFVRLSSMHSVHAGPHIDSDPNNDDDGFDSTPR